MLVASFLFCEARQEKFVAGRIDEFSLLLLGFNAVLQTGRKIFKIKCPF
jgi:hypothetical protein